MSIIVTQIRLPYGSGPDIAVKEAMKRVRAARSDVRYAGIYRESLDLRHDKISKIYSVEIELDSAAEEKRAAENDGSVYLKPEAAFPEVTGKKKLSHSPVVVGFGPAGMFAALILAERGFAPIVLERGARMERRDADVKEFFSTGKLNMSSNIQFGEGGAGAYSDGKLTTRINDPLCNLVLSLFEQYGAPKEVLRLAKPHIGTDLLKGIVVSIRKRIEQLGGKVFFDTPVTDILSSGGKLSSVVTPKGVFDTESCILAIGHSARDTVCMLNGKGMRITPKAFSVGLRIEHRKEWVDRSVYGKYYGKIDLPSAEYALSTKQLGRGCYSFCMCPGGEVIAAASEEGGVVVNGMSYHARAGRNSNAALCVSVGPDDFSSPLGGMDFQRSLEQKAFEYGGKNYLAPVQTVGNFLNGEQGKSLSSVEPTYPIGYTLTDFSRWLPGLVYQPLRSAIPEFAKKLSCFGRRDAVLTGVETRTSSPVRIERNAEMQAPDIFGLIPCGEGAGYAGGIMSAAVDGIRAASQILSVYEGIK